MWHMASIHTETVQKNRRGFLSRGFLCSLLNHDPRAPLDPARKNARPIFELPLALEILDDVVSPDGLVPIPEVGLDVPIPLPRAVALVVPRVPRVLTLPRPVPALLELAVASRCLWVSSARRRASARLLSSSAALRSAAAALAAASFSMSARSCVAPFQVGFKMSLWLCSVCERIRVHVLRSVEAALTVFETVCARLGVVC